MLPHDVPMPPPSSPVKVSARLATLAPPLVGPTGVSFALLSMKTTTTTTATTTATPSSLLHFLRPPAPTQGELTHGPTRSSLAPLAMAPSTRTMTPARPYEQRNVMSLSFIINPDEGDDDGLIEVAPSDAASSEEDVDSDDYDMASCYSSPRHHERVPVDTQAPPSSLCSKRNCYRQAMAEYAGFGAFCEFHKPSRLCKVPECLKCAKTGGYCISHGGGRRCHVDGCIKSAKEGGFCIAHGGGKRCKLDNCAKSALSGGLCSAHGGGKRCSVDDCSKTALKGGRCIAHGGGRRCEIDGCCKSAVGGHLCVSHGGGRRCREDGCSKGAVRKGLCIRHGARR